MPDETEQRKKHEHHQQLLKIKMQRIFGVIGNLIGVFFIVAGLISYLHPDRDVKNVKLHRLYGTISRLPERHSPGRGEYVSFKLNNYRDVEFNLSGFALRALSKPLTGAINMGDSVLMLLDDFNYTKLNSKAPHAMIGICTFRTKAQTFVSWDEYKMASIDDNRLGIIAALAGALLCAFYSRELYRGFSNRMKMRYF